MATEKTRENFTNYYDVKTKTINWCSKMHSEGLLTPEQYDDCVATFKDATTGILPKEFKTPSTGMERNFSLYNTRSKKLTPKLSNENTNTVMLVTNNGDYMACDTNNDLYFTKDIQKGEKITENSIKSIRPGFGLKPKFYEQVIGRTAKCDIARGTPVSFHLI